MSDHEKDIKSGRKSLKTLQRSADDVENLVGRPMKNLKQINTPDVAAAVELNKTKSALLSKETQVNFSNTIIDDLTNPKGASENYWKTLAETRQISLQKALETVDFLQRRVKELEHDLSAHKQMLEEANSFVEVFKEITQNNDDTGIDVNDISTIEESPGQDYDGVTRG